MFVSYVVFCVGSYFFDDLTHSGQSSCVCVCVCVCVKIYGLGPSWVVALEKRKAFLLK